MFKFLSLIAATCLPAVVFADTPHERQWHCQISSEIRGEGSHFMTYGRDSWTGLGSLYCQSGQQSQYRKVSVSFNSLHDGFGADGNSTVQLLMDVTTDMTPDELQIRAIVEDQDLTEKVRWEAQSERSAARVYITNSTPSEATRSLQLGTLFVRATEE